MPGKVAPHFKVHTFEGPLDLLLQLIEERKLPINEIALGEVTEQFLAHLRTMEEIHPEILVDFLGVAGKLLVIKSRALLPTLELDVEEEEAALDLTVQLQILQKYREIAKSLKLLDNRRRQSFEREPFTGQAVVFFPDPKVDTSALANAAQKLTSSLAEITKLPQHHVAEVISISEKIESLQHMLSQKVEIALKDLLKTSKSKTEVIVTFLALLELIKQKILTVEQEQLFAEIVIRKHGKES
jgi:segregation and condensation protein A